MTISRGMVLLLSALAAGSMLIQGTAFAADDAEAPQAVAQSEARKPDVVLNPGGEAKSEATETAQAEAPSAQADTARAETAAPASPQSEEGQEPVVENEGDGARARKPETEGANLTGNARRSRS